MACALGGRTCYSGSLSRRLAPQRAASGSIAPSNLQWAQDDKQLGELGWEPFYNEYRRWSLIAGGTSGQVHVATRVDNGCQLAVKTMPKVISRVPRSRILADIRQEAAAMERVKGCSGVAQLVDCREDTQYVYLLTELCKGGDLRRYVEKHGTLAEAQLSSVAHQVLTTVQACHSAGVLHGDIKPANWCFVDNQLQSAESLRLVDFGCSQFLGPHQRLDSKGIGSYAFLAPEVIHQDYSWKSDVWSIGVMLYWLFSHRFPFWDASQICNIARQDDVVEAVLTAPIAMDYGPWKCMSVEGINFISSCLVRDESQRLSVEQALAHPWVNRSTVEGAASSVSEA